MEHNSSCFRLGLLSLSMFGHNGTALSDGILPVLKLRDLMCIHINRFVVRLKSASEIVVVNDEH